MMRKSYLKKSLWIFLFSTDNKGGIITVLILHYNYHFLVANKKMSKKVKFTPRLMKASNWNWSVGIEKAT